MNIAEAIVLSIAILCATFIGMLMLASRSEKKQMPWISTEDRFPDRELEEERLHYGDDAEVEVIAMIKGFRKATTLSWDGMRFHDSCGDPYSVSKWMPFPVEDEDD